jgi:hypothetical protein
VHARNEYFGLLVPLAFGYDWIGRGFGARDLAFGGLELEAHRFSEGTSYALKITSTNTEKKELTACDPKELDTVYMPGPGVSAESLAVPA